MPATNPRGRGCVGILDALTVFVQKGYRDRPKHIGRIILLPDS
jgi:hypothetical protein